MEKVNLPANIRTIIYVLTVFGNAVLGAFIAAGTEVPIVVTAVAAGFNAVVALLAGRNVTPDKK